MDRSSRVLMGSGGSNAVICGVVFVMGITFRMKVIRPPSSPRCLSCLSVVYPGSLGVWCSDVSLVSCMSATSVLCFYVKCFSG